MDDAESDRLDEVEGLMNVLRSVPRLLDYRHWRIQSAQIGTLHCPRCSGPRRMSVTVLSLCASRTEDGQQVTMGLNQGRGFDPEQYCPGLVRYRCLQCDTLFVGVLYKGPNGPSVAVLPECYGGLATAHTPPEIAYYLDQAHRARCIGADTAAIAMYRSALEHLLYDHKYKARMCGPKIKELEAAIADGTAPKWAMELDTAFLDAIKKLGDEAIHPGRGDVAERSASESKLLRSLETVFKMLLFVVYESPHDQTRLRKELTEGTATLRKDTS